MDGSIQPSVVHTSERGGSDGGLGVAAFALAARRDCDPLAQLAANFASDSRQELRAVESNIRDSLATHARFSSLEMQSLKDKIHDSEKQSIRTEYESKLAVLNASKESNEKFNQIYELLQSKLK